MRFKSLLKRLFDKIVHDALPTALASILGGLLLTHFQIGQAPQSTTVRVTPASPEMMQLLRDEHVAIVDYVKDQAASEKNRGVAQPDPQPGLAEAAAPGPAQIARALPVARPTTVIASGHAEIDSGPRQEFRCRRLATGAAGCAGPVDRRAGSADGACRRFPDGQDHRDQGSGDIRHAACGVGDCRLHSVLVRLGRRSDWRRGPVAASACRSRQRFVDNVRRGGPIAPKADVGC